jgi:hypothetical protein
VSSASTKTVSQPGAGGELPFWQRSGPQGPVTLAATTFVGQATGKAARELARTQPAGQGCLGSHANATNPTAATRPTRPSIAILLS